MRLLVSVADADDAAAALAGGADLIDAKDPSRGALGAVSDETLQRICAAVSGARPVTAALGDARDEAELEQAARRAATSGVEFIKVGFDSASSPAHISALIEAAVRGASRTRSDVVAVTYADGPALLAPALIDTLIDTAARAGARGVLIDTAHKNGPGLRQLMTPAALERWIAAAHGAHLFAAVAGKLTPNDLPFVQDAGADIAGVRGAACEGGRAGRVVAHKVRELISVRGTKVRGCEGARAPGAGVRGCDVVVKLGGAMLAHPASFAAVLATIAAASHTRRIVVVPGGGPFADAVRGLSPALSPSDDAAHWMAILGMDQYAHLIAERLPRAAVVDTPQAIAAALEAGQVPVLAPFRWLRQADPLPHSWDVTSDSIAAWVASEVGARQVMLVKAPQATGEDLVDPYFRRALPPGVEAGIVPADALGLSHFAPRTPRTPRTLAPSPLAPSHLAPPHLFPCA